MKRIIIFICLTLILLFSASSVYADNEKFSDETNVLTKLGIIKEEHEFSEIVTRGDFVASAIAFFGDMAYDERTNIFTDVTDNIGEINTAAKLGIVNGFGDGTFRPSDEITWEQAAKILVDVLGYEVETRDIYSSGYLSTASKLNLFKGINMSDTVTWDLCAKLLYNALNTDVLQNKLNGEYKAVKGQTPLTLWLGVNVITGSIDATEYATLNGSVAPKGHIRIGGIELCEDGLGAVEHIGETVTAYYSEDTLLCFVPKGIVSTYTVLSEDLLENSTVTKLNYIAQDTKNKSLVIDDNALYTYNGKQAAPSATLFPKDGRIEAVDTDSDGKADIVKIFNAKTIVADTVNIEKHFITDLYSDEKITVDDDSVIIGYDGITDISAISKNDVLSVYESLDSSLITIEVSKIKIKSIVQEIGNDYLKFANGESYKVFNKDVLSNVNVGDTLTVYLDVNERIAGSSIPRNKKMKYGYLIAGEAKKKLGRYVAQLRLFDISTGTIINYTVAEDVSLNDRKLSVFGRPLNDGRVLIADFKIGGELNTQLLKFTTNNDGEISKLYTYIDNTSEPFSAQQYQFTKDYDFPASNRGGITYNYLVYDSVSNSIGNEVSLSGTTCVMLPVLKNGETLADREKDIRIFSPEQQWRDPNHRVGNFAAYDMNEDRCAAVVIQEYDIKTSSRVDPEFLYVDSVVTAFENGDFTTKIRGYQKGTYVDYRISSENTSMLNNSYATLKRGDVIQVLKDDTGIIKIEKLFSIDEKTDLGDYRIYSDVSSDYVISASTFDYRVSTQPYWYEKLVVLHGRAQRVSGVNIFFDLANSVKGKFLPTVSAQVMVYDELKDSFKIGTLADIEPDNLSQTLLVRLNYSAVKEIYVINRKAAVDLKWGGLY